MLKEYFEYEGYDKDARHRRLIAVQAAMEIVKASVSATSASSSSSRVQNCLDGAAESIDRLADAIQAAIEKDEK
ncbi:hypothetical protein A7P61_17125 [Pantoea agglomerans pv. betae]|jgi:hypothetical protein|uniref:hypothetical protein n=1 Tax=Enterobacter agglomerans TaxID=549 RepID=UPI0007E597B2|nr:hypothetical protein [Pantoea agglomerans]WHU82995.1 hypothetical protein A7P61_17125 [Pantoea agglomerans pv. betae]